MSIEDRQYGSFQFDSALQAWRRLVKDHDSIALLQKIVGGDIQPIPVYFLDIGLKINIYSEVSVVISSSETVILTYTVPPLKKLYLEQVDAGGDNIAEYKILIDSQVEAKKRTYFGSSLDIEAKFGENNGICLIAGTTIDVTVIHYRPNASDFDCRIVGVLRDE
jgi:hypothetical protein